MSAITLPMPLSLSQSLLQWPCTVDCAPLTEAYSIFSVPHAAFCKCNLLFRALYKCFSESWMFPHLAVCQLSTKVFQSVSNVDPTIPKLFFPVQPSWWVLQQPSSFASYLRQHVIICSTASSSACGPPALWCVPLTFHLPEVDSHFRTCCNFVWVGTTSVISREESVWSLFHSWGIERLRSKGSTDFSTLFEAMRMWWFGHMWHFRSWNTHCHCPLSVSAAGRAPASQVRHWKLERETYY